MARSKTTANTKTAKSINSKSRSLISNSLARLSLRNLNLVLVALLAIQAVLILIFSKTGRGDVPINLNFATKDTLSTTAAGHPVMVAAAHHLFDLDLAWLVAAFLLASALSYLMVATRLRVAYEAALNKGQSPHRWISSAMVVSLMVASVALLSGMYDIASLLMFVAILVMACLANLPLESNRADKTRSRWVKVGASALLLPVVLLIYLISSHAYGGGLPLFVIWIYVSLFVLFATMAWLARAWHHKAVTADDFVNNEKLYFIVFFVAQAALAWQIFAGTLR